MPDQQKLNDHIRKDNGFLAQFSVGTAATACRFLSGGPSIVVESRPSWLALLDGSIRSALDWIPVRDAMLKD